MQNLQQKLHGKTVNILKGNIIFNIVKNYKKS